MLHLLVEILLENIRLKRAARFARDDEDRFRHVELLRQSADLRGIGGIENENLRIAVDFSVGEFHHFHAQTRTAHAQQHRMGETGLANLVCDLLEIAAVRNVVVGNREPAEPARFVLICPERGVASPQALHFLIRLPVVEGRFHGSREILRQLVGEVVHGRRCGLRGVSSHGREKLVESLGEKFYSFFGQLVGSRFHRDPGALERIHGLLRRRNIFFEARARLSVVAECVVGGRRNRVHRVRPDQFLDVQNIRELGILRACAGPEYALRLRALGGKGCPSRPAENFLVALVGQLRVGDRYFTHQFPKRSLFGRVLRFLDSICDLAVDQSIDAADEKARDASDVAHLAACLRERLKPRDICLGHPLVDVLREKQSHVDVDSFADELLNRREAFRSSRNFHHQIFAAHRFPEPARLVDRLLRLVREIRSDFEAHIPIAPMSLIVDGPQHVGGILNIANRERFVHLLGIEIFLRAQFLERFGVIGAASDGLLEYGGIGRDAAQTVLLDQAGEFSR